MTVKERTLNLRFQVYVDFATGDRGILVNSYSNHLVAQRASKALMSGPASFVTGSWVVDTEMGARSLDIKEHYGLRDC